MKIVGSDLHTRYQVAMLEQETGEWPLEAAPAPLVGAL
jgi:hypothetical protein